MVLLFFFNQEGNIVCSYNISSRLFKYLSVLFIVLIMTFFAKSNKF